MGLLSDVASGVDFTTAYANYLQNRKNALKHAVAVQEGIDEAPYPAQQYYEEGHDGGVPVPEPTSASESSQQSVNDWSSALSDLISGYQNTAEANALAQRNFNEEQARLNREWQEYMSNTSHQREMADLEAAGLNPILTAMGGQGASTPSGSAASASMAETINGLDSISSLVVQSMRDVQSAAQREMEMVQFDRSLSEEQRQFRVNQIHSAVRESLYFIKDVAGMIMTGGLSSAAQANSTLDTYETYGYTDGKLTSKYRGYVK